jgi:hypothetical protein
LGGAKSIIRPREIIPGVSRKRWTTTAAIISRTRRSANLFSLVKNSRKKKNSAPDDDLRRFPSLEIPAVLLGDLVAKQQARVGAAERLELRRSHRMGLGQQAVHRAKASAATQSMSSPPPIHRPSRKHTNRREFMMNIRF